jgi:hydrogenase maturation protease
MAGPVIGAPDRPRPGTPGIIEMNRIPQRCLLLALGNDILKDEGVGLAAARLLRAEFQEEVDILEVPGAGLALLELLEGYDQALVLDAVFTGYAPPGTILEFSREDFQQAAAPAAHYVGLPEILRQAECLGLAFPRELRVLALELENPFELHAGMSPSTREALPGYVHRARQVLRSWIS